MHKYQKINKNMDFFFFCQFPHHHIFTVHIINIFFKTKPEE